MRVIVYNLPLKNYTKITQMPEKQYLSKEKYEELENELQTLETVTRKEVADKLEYARSLGDLSENAEYHDARNQQAEVEARIEEIKNTLKYSEIFTAGHYDEVTVGCTVSIKKGGASEIQTYQIVGSEEADISQNKLSFQSPLGSAMMGKKKGEKFSFETPKGVVDYTVVSIE